MMYSYCNWQDLLARGRGGRKVLFRSMVLTESEGVLYFRLFDVLAATMEKDNVMTLTMPVEDMGSTTVRSRMAKLLNGRYHFYSDRGRHGNKQNRIRFYSGANAIPYGIGAPPYTPGMRLQAPKGTLLNPEICKDFVKTLDRSAAYKIRQEMSALTKLVRVSHRLEAISLDEQGFHTSTNIRYQDARARLLGKEDYTQVSFDDVEDILAVGKAHTTGAWRFSRLSDGGRKKYLQRVIDNGIKHILTQRYQAQGLYSFTEKEKE